MTRGARFNTRAEPCRHVASLAKACCLNPGRARSTIAEAGGPVQPPNEQRVERRLAAIFAADVAGYSRLMSQDEAGTLRALAAAREVMDRLIRDHGGRIANTAGDSVLAEFPSAVDAVQCAVTVHQNSCNLVRSHEIDTPDKLRPARHKLRMRKTLTARQCETLSCPAPRRRIDYRDTVVPGLCLRVTATAHSSLQWR